MYPETKTYVQSHNVIGAWMIGIILVGASLLYFFGELSVADKNSVIWGAVGILVFLGYALPTSLKMCVSREKFSWSLSFCGIPVRFPRKIDAQSIASTQVFQDIERMPEEGEDQDEHDIYYGALYGARRGGFDNGQLSKVFTTGRKGKSVLKIVTKDKDELYFATEFASEIKNQLQEVTVR